MVNATPIDPAALLKDSHAILDVSLLPAGEFVSLFAIPLESSVPVKIEIVAFGDKLAHNLLWNGAEPHELGVGRENFEVLSWIKVIDGNVSWLILVLFVLFLTSSFFDQALWSVFLWELRRAQVSWDVVCVIKDIIDDIAELLQGLSVPLHVSDLLGISGRKAKHVFVCVARGVDAISQAVLQLSHIVVNEANLVLLDLSLLTGLRKGYFIKIAISIPVVLCERNKLGIFTEVCAVVLIENHVVSEVNTALLHI